MRQDTVILEGSERTAFVYRIDGGMDERDCDEIESMDSGYVLGQNWPSVVSNSVDLHHRMNYIRERNLGFSYIGIKDNGFETELTSIDMNLPITLAFMVSDFYRNGTQRITDLLDNTVRKNPAGLTDLADTKPYHRMMDALLEHLSGEKVRAEDCFFEKIPADKFDCASISKLKDKVYLTTLVLKIVVKPSLKA